MAQLEHIEAIENRLWGAADTLHDELAELNKEAVALAKKIEANFKELTK